jgi:hypothetical protein
MKPKKISKKLTLNKSTVAVLNGNEGKKVKGGTAMTTVQKPCDCNTKTDCEDTNGPCTEYPLCGWKSQYFSECLTDCTCPTWPLCCGC